MEDNDKIIEQTGALNRLTEDDIAMLEKHRRRLSSSMCSVLRHNPEKIGIQMDERGWVNAAELIRKFNSHNAKHRFYLNLPILMDIVKNDDKRRYGLKGQGQHLMIRCRQGHSIPWLRMDYAEALPPDVLYHGTITPFLPSIMKDGLLPMQRQKVHLSADTRTAQKVAERRQSKGNPMILQVDAKQMAQDGVIFYLSENGVWLTDHVDTKYLIIYSG